MEDLHIEIIKDYAIDNKSILKCYEQLTRSYFCQHRDFVTFYFYLKQLQYEFYTQLKKHESYSHGRDYEIKITSFKNEVENEIFRFSHNPNTIALEIKINDKVETLSFFDFLLKYFNLREENFYRAERLLEKFIDYELKTSVKTVFRMPLLKSKFENYSFSKLRLLLKYTDSEINNFIDSNLINPKMTVKEIEQSLKTPTKVKDKGPTLDYDYDHYPLYSLEEFDNFKQNETKFYLHQTYVQYHESKKEIQILNEMIKILSNQLISEDKGQQKIITEVRAQAKSKIKGTTL